MARPNEELFGEMLDAFQARDLDRFLACLDPDIEVIPVVGSALADTVYRGHDGVRDWWDRMFSVFPKVEVSIDEIHDLGGRTIAASRFHGQAVAGGARSDLVVWTVTDVRDGKIVSWRTFRTEAEALELVSGEQKS
jgi:ketosteroid isomerase-like protein